MGECTGSVEVGVCRLLEAGGVTGGVAVWHVLQYITVQVLWSRSQPQHLPASQGLLPRVPIWSITQCTPVSQVRCFGGEGGCRHTGGGGGIGCMHCQRSSCPRRRAYPTCQ